MDMLVPPHAPTPIYAGFWRRFNAYGIDATFVVIAAWLIQYALTGNAALAQTPDDLKQLTDALTAAQSGQVPPQLMDSVKASLISSMVGGSAIGPNEIITMVVSAIYNILFACGEWQATPGKRWLRMKIINADGSKLTLKQSAMRHAMSGLSMLPLGLGCLTICYTREKLAPHDMICHTRVIMCEPTV